MTNLTGVNSVRKSKYRNRKTEYKGRLYDSAKEAKHAGFLDMCRRAANPGDRVVKWFPQVPFEFECGTKMIIDFVVLFADYHWELHEVKSKPTRTKAYMIKKRLLRHEYGLEVKEI